MFDSIDHVIGLLADENYIANRTIATVVYLASQLEKPILVEGPAGVGKTELAKVLAARSAASSSACSATRGSTRPRRSTSGSTPSSCSTPRSCRTRSARCSGGARVAGARRSTASPARTTSSSPTRFLLPRPLLRAITVGRAVRAADRRDRQVRHRVRGVPARGAVRLPGERARARHARARATCRSCVLTSNNAREMSDALKRRCLHLYIDFPDRAQELEIVQPQGARASRERLAGEVVDGRAAHPQARSEEGAEHQRDARLGAGADAAQRRRARRASWSNDTLTVILKYEGDIRKAQQELKELPASCSGRSAKRRRRSDKDVLH